MAEERLIDEDKDRKYRIRINEDGEEELVLDNSADGEEDESDIPVFDIPVYEEDDEEAAVLTPEQLAERERLRAEEEKARSEKIAGLVTKARTHLDEQNFEDALYALSLLDGVADENGEYYCLKLKTLTRNLTDFHSLEESAKAADGVKEYADKESKGQLKEMSSGLKQRIAEAEEKAEDLRKKTEEGKEERRADFLRTKVHAQTGFILSAVPFAVFAILTIVFSTMMFSAENGAFLIATIALGALTFVAFICVLVASNRLWAAVRNCKLNEKDGSTRLGREYLDSKKECELLKRIYSSFDNDLS